MTPQVAEIRLACARMFNWWQNKMFSEVFLDYGIADLVFLSKAGYATEVEIKCSLSDLKADASKVKWKKPRPFVKRFYFAMPYDLAKKAKVPKHAGLLGIRGGFVVHSFQRASVNQKAMRVPLGLVQRWHSGLHGKYWREQLDLYASGLKETNQ